MKQREHTGRRRNEAARADILAAAAALIADPAGGAVTVDAIAARAGVGKQTIYRWWPSKYAVLLDALTERARLDVPTASTGTLEGDLAAFLRTSFQAASQPATGGFLRTTMAEAQRDPAAAEVLRVFTERRRAALSEVLRRHVEDDRTVELLVDQVYGVLWYRLLVGHQPLTRAAADALAAALTRQVETRSIGS